MNLISPPRLAVARSVTDLTPSGGGFDIDLLHAMEERDEALIADAIMHGSMTGKFVYDFEIGGTQVCGVSVIGARHLAHFYGGLKHRLITSTLKRGAQFIYTTYPGEYSPRMAVSVESIELMADDPDFYSVLCEIVDTKKGNTIQRERSEHRYERKRDGSFFERPNFQSMAQAKAYRNGILDLLPQDVVLAFKAEAKKLGRSENITENVIETKRRNILTFAASKAIAVDRNAVQQLGWEQIAGLSEAARIGPNDFVRSAASLGIVSSRAFDVEEASGEAATRPAQAKPAPQLQQRETRGRGRPPRTASSPPPDDSPPANPDDYGQPSAGTRDTAPPDDAGDQPAEPQQPPAEQPQQQQSRREDLF
jgi:hypothetical protein